MTRSNYWKLIAQIAHLARHGPRSPGADRLPSGAVHELGQAGKGVMARPGSHGVQARLLELIRVRLGARLTDTHGDGLSPLLEDEQSAPLD